MRLFFLAGFSLCVSLLAVAQQTKTIKGTILAEQTGLPLASCQITIEGTTYTASSDTSGRFQLNIEHKDGFILHISRLDYIPKRLPIAFETNTTIALGNIFLKKDITLEKTDNLITLTEADLSDDSETISSSIGLLQATRDVFLRRAAFDFGQAFFRVRGYDAQNGNVLLNGIVMNKFLNGRPQWNNWGGLNDVIRNQEFTNGLAASAYTFGGILGNTNINLRPSGMRPGIRLSSSVSNRTYTGRFMATYSSGLSNNGISYTLSASRRLAGQGHIQGTLYDAYSLFGGLEYQFNTKHSIGLTAILAKNRRGRSAAITEEVFNLVGSQYNPYWGKQDGRIRNSRERNIFEPILLLNHYVTTQDFKLTTGLAYQGGTRTRSRLGYYNAPNPDPTYYRYLPSFYINNPIGADFTNASLARDGFLNDPQLNWSNISTANSNTQNSGRAAYVLYDDVIDDTQFSFSSVGNLKINNWLNIDFGVVYRNISSGNYAKIKDLIGADFHEDIDPFSNTRNDINSTTNKTSGATFNYDYDIDASNLNGFGQLTGTFDNWSGFVSASLSNTVYQRNGMFQNERFLNTSLGLSEEIKFSDYGLKGGTTYKITGRHWLKAHGILSSRAPVLQNVFINPRENNEVVPKIQSEMISSFDLNYFIRLPDLTGRITGFYTRFQNTTDINFFFVDSGVGSDFVQEVLTDLDKLHKGIELGLEYQASSTVKLSAVANLGDYEYASNPLVTINFDTAGAEEDLIDPEGNIELGNANIKGLKLAQGPQLAFALGIEHRNPKYWWVGATANYLANNYANISTITRTQSFFLNPDTGTSFPEATQENVGKLLAQSKLDDFYLLNLVGGKSWLKNGTYISVFASINNAFDTVFRTGGFEQSRNGNFGQLQQDSLRDNPSFAPKFWYGFGRTYFLNFAISF